MTVLFRISVLFLLSAAFAAAQTGFRNSVVFTGGSARDVNAFCCETETALSLGITYGYRPVAHLQLEAGLTAALSSAPEIRGANYDIRPADRFFWVPFGARGILPVSGGRVELSLSGGGLYEKYQVSNPASVVGLVSRDGWGGYLAGGAALAIDRSRHFWLGVSPHWFMANAGNARDRWLVIAGDFGFRF